MADGPPADTSPEAALAAALALLRNLGTPELVVEAETLIGDALATHPMGRKLVAGEVGAPSDMMATPLAERLAARFAERDDALLDRRQLVQLAMAGFQEAVDGFEPELELPFDCWAWGRIHARLLAGVAEARGAAAPDACILAARKAAYEILDIDDSPDPNISVSVIEDDDRPPLHRFCSILATAMLVGWSGCVLRQRRQTGS